MKRVLVFLLAMMLIVSSFALISVGAAEEQKTSELTTTKVVVYKQDFETAELPDSWKSGNSAQFSMSLDTDSTGNKYLKAGNWQAENIARLGANWVQTDGVWHKALNKEGKEASFRIAAEAIQGRVSDSTNTVVLKNGVSYDYTWDGIAKGNGEVKVVDFGSSGINKTAGGVFLAYNSNGSIKGTISQLYGTYQGCTTPDGVSMKSVKGQDLGNGWYSAGYSGLAYPLVKSDSERDVPVDSVTLNGFFYQCSTPVDLIKNLLISEKAYCGSGFTDCASSKFTITKDDLYGDEAKVDKTGKTWTEDELCREWNLNEDCTPLYSAQRVAISRKLLTQLIFSME